MHNLIIHLPFFARDWQTILRDGLDSRRVLVVALASALGLGLHNHDIMRDLFGDDVGGLLGNGVTIGAVVAIGMTLVLEATGTRRSRLETTMDMDSLPAIDEFLTGLAARLGWNETSTLRLRAAGEETLASLQMQVDDDEGSEHPRLIINARPQGTIVELEFVATTRQENVEDQLAYLSDEVSVQTFDDLSLRLLRHYSAAVRHQKFHGVDIVTVQVTDSAGCRTLAGGSAGYWDWLAPWRGLCCALFGGRCYYGIRIIPGSQGCAAMPGPSSGRVSRPRWP